MKESTVEWRVDGDFDSEEDSTLQDDDMGGRSSENTKKRINGSFWIYTFGVHLENTVGKISARSINGVRAHPIRAAISFSSLWLTHRSKGCPDLNGS